MPGALDQQPQQPSQIPMPNVDLIRAAIPGPGGIELANAIQQIVQAFNQYVARKGG